MQARVGQEVKAYRTLGHVVVGTLVQVVHVRRLALLCALGPHRCHTLTSSYAPAGRPPGTNEAQTRAVSPASRASATAKSRST